MTGLFIGQIKPPVSNSGLLTVLVEPDAEEPDDKYAWIVVAACEGEKLPEYFRGGWLHTPTCACSALDAPHCQCRCPGGVLCAVGWLQEYLACVGEKDMLKNLDEKLHPGTGFVQLLVTGRMVSESYGDSDVDEYFKIERVEVVK